MKDYIVFISFSLIVSACSDSQPKKEIPGRADPAVYTLATVEKEAVSASIKLPAQFAAYQEVSIFPKVNGYVKSVTVDIGSKVSKGQLVMILEAPELLQAALQAKEKYARSKADFSIDKEHYLRFLEASATAGAVSPLDLSILRGKMEADSLLSNAEKMNWQMQETMLGYLRVTAPFSGVVTERNVHPGALVSAAAKDKPMLELKQVEHLRLQVEVPEAFAAGLKNKDTVCFYTGAMHGKKMSGYISRQSMNMNAQYRSEKMEIDVQNRNGNLSPGMYADIILYSNGNINALTVPSAAVVISTERKYVLVSKNRKIIKVEVTTGNEMGGKTEVFGNLQPGDKVIVNAGDEVKENS